MMRQLGSLGWVILALCLNIGCATLVPVDASAQTAQSEPDPTPVACLCVEDWQDVPATRLGCEEAAAGVYAAGLIRPLMAEDTTTGLPGCDAATACGGEVWLCFGVGTAERGPGPYHNRLFSNALPEPVFR